MKTKYGYVIEYDIGDGWYLHQGSKGKSYVYLDINKATRIKKRLAKENDFWKYQITKIWFA